MMQDENLINAVREHPVLFDPRLKSFKDRVKKAAAWRAVSAAVGYPEDECQYRWKCLRDKFVREKKKVDGDKTSGAGAPSSNVWPLLEIMMFLKDTVAHRVSVGNMPKEEQQGRTASPILECLANGGDEAEPQSSTSIAGIPALGLEVSTNPSSSSSCSSPCMPGKRRKKGDQTDKYLLEIIKSTSEQINQNCSQKELDPNDHFLLSLKPYLTALSEQKQSYAKIQIMELLHNFQFDGNE